MSLADFNLRTPEKVKPKKLVTPHLAGLGQAELLSLRDQIDDLLTETHLKEVNLSKELLLQLKKAKILQKNTEDDEDVPANQRAQVQNSLGTILLNLAKHQQVTYSSERFKRLETATIKCVKTLPKAQQESFFETYLSEAEIELS